EEPASLGERRDTERDERERDREERVETGRRDARPHEEVLAEDGDGGPHQASDGELYEHEPERRDTGRRVLRDRVDEDDGEDDRHRIIEAGLQLDGGADALADLDAAAAQNGEDRRGVGRRDDRAEEERLLPREPHGVRREGDEARGR